MKVWLVVSEMYLEGIDDVEAVCLTEVKANEFTERLRQSDQSMGSRTYRFFPMDVTE